MIVYEITRFFVKKKFGVSTQTWEIMRFKLTFKIVWEVAVFSVEILRRFFQFKFFYSELLPRAVYFVCAVSNAQPGIS